MQENTPNSLDIGSSVDSSAETVRNLKDLISKRFNEISAGYPDPAELDMAMAEELVTRLVSLNSEGKTPEMLREHVKLTIHNFLREKQIFEPSIVAPFKSMNDEIVGWLVE